MESIERWYCEFQNLRRWFHGEHAKSLRAATHFMLTLAICTRGDAAGTYPIARYRAAQGGTRRFLVRELADMRLVEADGRDVRLTDRAPADAGLARAAIAGN